MSDVDSEADSISDSSNAHSDDDLMSWSFTYSDAGDFEEISPAVRELCDRLRVNDPCGLAEDFIPFNYNRSELDWLAIFQAVKENTSVKRIYLWSHEHTKKSAEIAAKYLESSKTLRKVNLNYGGYSQESPAVISLFLQALSRSTSVMELIIYTESIRFASVAFQELLTSTQTLQKLEICSDYQDFDEVQLAAITSGFANNTTLRDLEFRGWREVDLAPVLTALQDHPALQKIQFRPTYSNNCLPCVSGLEVLLRSRDSKVKELVLEQVSSSTVGLRPLTFQQVSTSTVGLHAVLEELGCNTTVTNLVIKYCGMSGENLQQLKSMLRQNTSLQSLDLTSSGLRSAGLAQIAPVLYRNTSIKALDLKKNGLHDIESANVLRELVRRNKTITTLCIARTVFGRNAAAVRSIADGVRSNTALQQFDLSWCGLDDQGISVLANALAIRNASILELNLRNNEITSVGVHALVEAMKTLTKLSLAFNPVKSEGAAILADALGRNAMPSLKRLDLGWCGIDDDGVVALVSALEQNTSLQILSLVDNCFGERSFRALAESLPNIEGLQQIKFTTYGVNLSTTIPLLLEGFRKNTSLVEVDILGFTFGEWSQEIKLLVHRNRFTPLLKASDPPGASPWLGIWSRALAKVATEPDALFSVLRNKPKLAGSGGRDDE
jgi:Ran GTPase-activating protein (RanGAP) involved in mRNA processing and transport